MLGDVRRYYDNRLRYRQYSLSTDFLKASLAMLPLITDGRNYKNDCLEMLEEANALLLAVLALSTKSDAARSLPMAQLSVIGDFTLTLHKIRAYLEGQQESRGIRKLLRQAEMNKLAKSCRAELQGALDVFKIRSMNYLEDMNKLQKEVDGMHQEVLDMIESRSERSHTASPISNFFANAGDSSGSISLLPPHPKIFRGRNVELAHILEAVKQPKPRIAILGAGGIGKTALARAALHHPELTLSYGENRFFVPCDTASGAEDLAALIGSYLGLKIGSNMIKQTLHKLSNGPPALVILDTMETVWEPAESRQEIENFLSLLSDIEHLALIITMRGTERPLNVNWSRPFLPSLQPLADDAARQVFLEIADDAQDFSDIDQILLLTENMPLAIDLIAHLAEAEGCASVLSRWQVEKTGLFSEGFDRRSNLDISISLSLLSPRLASTPQARELLSLMSILPDGLSDAELVQSNLPMENILACKVALLRTSLAYTTPGNRLRVLVPIREHMQKYHPPQIGSVNCLFREYRAPLALFYSHNGPLLAEIVPRISSIFANIQNVVIFMVQHDHQNPKQAVYSGLHLNTFSRLTRQERSQVMEYIPAAFPYPTDYRLETCFISECFATHLYHKIQDADSMVDRALFYLSRFDDPEVKCKFFNKVGYYYYMHSMQNASKDFLEKALSIAIATENTSEQSSAHCGLAWNYYGRGDYTAAQEHAIKGQKAAQISADLFTEANALAVEATCLANLGSYVACVSRCQRGRSLLALWGVSGGPLDNQITIVLADVHRLKSEYREARTIQAEILKNLPPGPESYIYGMVRMNIAELDIALGAPVSEVQKNIDAAMGVLRGQAFLTDLAICETTQADLYSSERNYAAASDILTRNLKVVWGTFSGGTNLILEKLADLSRHDGAALQLTWPTVLLVHAMKCKEKQFVYRALQILGERAFMDGSLETAASLLNVALDAFTQMDIHRGRAECMMQLGDISKARGDVSRAGEHWRSALPLFERSSQEKKMVLIRERLASTTATAPRMHAL